MFLASSSVLAAPAAGASPAVTMSVLFLLIAAAVVMCLWVGHRWSTLVLGVLIGVYLTGPVADTTKSVVAQVIGIAVSGISQAVG
ncbi:hypothetical protein ABT160_25910 [Streptomyces sp. NPDC001941]|uniref:hypothetical protein n=1 Tax=Streptomyces sp. NPDC001941 TaxID=3154659 RepID=UPI003317B3E3